MNPLIRSTVNNNPALSNFAQISNIINMLRSGNPQQIAINLMQKNPQFKNFINLNKGKSPDQVANEYGINLNQLIEQLK